jgi:c(7)-type cytochrome triheme protein
MKKLLCAGLVLLSLVGLAWAQGGVMKKKPLPYEYGAVTISNFSAQAGIAPVVFDHWIHRQYYTCRLCHVDIGFGMTPNSTQIRAADNSRGYFCGTCHNGRSMHNSQKIFASCASEYTREDYKRCVRCHLLEPGSTKQEAFYRFAEKMPRETFGNGIDWEKAEVQGLIKPIDYLEGVSVKKVQMKNQPDFAIKAKTEGMPDIIFSHTKHTVWNGCELCHPDLFLGVKKGATKYTMTDLFAGKYCGACHVKVAFPQTDCQRCHSKPLQ